MFHSIFKTFLSKQELPTYEAMKKKLFLPMRHSSIYVLYVPTKLKMNLKIRKQYQF